MKITLTNATKSDDVVKRMVFLAYNACGGARGMGFIQEARLGGVPAEEETVWGCAYNREDYMGVGKKENEVYCDYVFGRMMKWGCKWTEDTVEIWDKEFRGDYQGFAHKYPDNKSLALAALESLGVKDFSLTP